MTNHTDPNEAAELAEIRKLARQRALEALREGIPRASMMAVIVKLLSETGNLEPPEPEDQGRLTHSEVERLPFPPSFRPLGCNEEGE